MKTNIEQQRVFLQAAKKTLITIALVVAVAYAANAQDTNTFPGTGNAGIGTLSPGNLLQINSGASPSASQWRITANSTGSLSALTYAADNAAIGFDVDFSANNWIARHTSAALVYKNSNKLIFKGQTGLTSGNSFSPIDRVTLDLSNGYFGIGTTSPERKFHLNESSGGSVYTKITNSDTGVTATDGLFIGYGADETAYVSNAENTDLKFETNNATRMTILAGGNIGIGTTTPNTNLVGAYSYPASVRLAQIDSTQARLVVRGSTDTGIDLIDANAAVKWMQLYNDAGVTKFRSVDDSANLKADNVVAMDNSTGNVGIGTAPTTYRLDVNGNTNVTGNLNVTGTINAKYQDVAEWVPSSEQLSAGTVVVLDTTRSNQVISSTVKYDTRVAGVISAQPGITLGEGGETKVLVATTGRVRVKVDASRGPIQIGDLLVTSDVAGVAMKSEPVEFAGRKMHMPGTIIGKALEPLAKGSGEILVLLSLQ